MIKLVYWLLIGGCLLTGSALANAVSPPVSKSSVSADTLTPADNPLRIILDSLRNRPNLKGLKIKLQDITFETNSFVLTAQSATYLDTVASVLNKLPAVMLEIGGHTDNVGTPRSNQLLSQNRARAVHARLVGAGKVAAKRVTFRGYGEERPVATNATDGGRSLNRRVEMQFVGLDSRQLTRIYLRNGQVISAALFYVNDQNRSIAYKTSEDTPLLELPCGSVEKIEFADGRVQVLDCPLAPGRQAAPAPSPDPAPNRSISPLYAQVYGNAGYMLGESPSWTGKTNGYAHILGFGGGVLVGYRLSPRLSAGLQTGYFRWSTRVDYRQGQDGPVLSQYYSDATQIPLFVFAKIYVTESVYVMPEGGVNFLGIKAGFDASRDSYSGLQTGYGIGAGYTTNRSKKLWGDVGLFYRAHQKVTWNSQYGVPSMHYVGVKLGLGFSL